MKPFMKSLSRADKVVVAVSLLVVFVCFVQSCRERSRYRQLFVWRYGESTEISNLRVAYRGIDGDSFILPDDIVSEDGEPLLSWRVALALLDARVSTSGLGTCDFPFKLDEPWDSPYNIPALEKKPQFCFFPYKDKGKNKGKTCLVRIKEVHEALKAGYDFGDDSRAAYVIFVDPESSVPWTRPQDVSIKDLASGKVKLFPTLCSFYGDVNCGGRYLNDEDIPRTEDE